MPKQYRTGNPYADRIIKLIDKLTASGNRPDVVFQDWLDLVDVTLKAGHTAAITFAEHGQGLPDTPETATVHQRLRKRYTQPWHFEHFAQAFAILLESIDREAPEDVLGEIYMAYGYPNTWAGQFFTPLPVARMMARMTMSGVEDLVHERLKAAIARSPLAEAALLAGAVLDGREAHDWFLWRVVAAALPEYQPVTVSDPCCGSGVMFLAAASCLPRWMTDFGLVQFFGQDVDSGCVRMAQINVMLYGLNGWGARWALSTAIMAQTASTAAAPGPKPDVEQTAKRESPEPTSQARPVQLAMFG